MVTAIAERSASGDERGATSGSAQGGGAANDDRRGIATGCREKLRLKRADGKWIVHTPRSCTSGLAPQWYQHPTAPEATQEKGAAGVVQCPWPETQARMGSPTPSRADTDGHTSSTSGVSGIGNDHTSNLISSPLGMLSNVDASPGWCACLPCMDCTQWGR